MNFKASTILARAPLAFAIPDYQFINSVILAAEAMADQLPETKADLGARNNDSAFMLGYWDKADDVIAGYDAIKNGREKYLPRFTNEKDNAYALRVDATKFTNVFRDIVESLASKPFEEEIKLEQDDSKTVPDAIVEFAENVDGAGNNLTAFAANTFFNGIAYAIDWIYVDYPKVDATVVRTRLDEKTRGIRPFWSHVLGRNVLEARTAVINSEEILVFMRILEPAASAGGRNHIRVFERVGTDAVMFGLFEEHIESDGKTKRYVLIDSGPITIGVIPLVPFITGRRDGRSFKLAPAMRDALDLQIKLYVAESRLEWLEIISGYPMLTGNGIKSPKGPDGKPMELHVGPNVVLYSEPDGAGNSGSWAYVQPDPAIMVYAQKKNQDTMNELRELGRQPLTAQSSNLTVVTTAYAAGKAKTAVAAWGLRLQDTLENALVLTCKWLNIKPDAYDPAVKVYDEYDDFNTDQNADLTALATMREKRDISQETYWREMTRRNVLSPDFDPEKEKEALLSETPSDILPDPNAEFTKPPLKVVPK